MTVSQDNDPRAWRGAFYSNLESGAIEPSDPWYLDLFARGVLGSDEIERLANEVSFMRDGEMAFLTGLRGSGKSTQLLRLDEILTEEGLAVVRLDAEDLLNVRSAIDETQLLIALAGGIPERAGATFDLPELEGDKPWARLRDWLKGLPGRVQLDPEAKATTGPLVPFAEASIKASLRADESFARQVEEYLQGRTGELLAKADEYVEDTVKSLRTKFEAAGKPWKGLVVIVDSLDHVRGSATDEEDFQRVREALERLFTARRNAISLTKCRFVYCLPPFIDAGDTSWAVPHVRVRHRDGTPDDEGIAALEEVVSLRTPGGDVGPLLTKTQLRRLISCSGGSLRDLFRLVQTVLVTPTMPADDAAIDEAIGVVARSMESSLTDDARRSLASIAETKQLPLPDQSAWTHLAPLFDRYIVLRYRNGEQWYDVHPLVSPA